MDIKKTNELIDKCMAVRMAIYLEGEHVPAPINPEKDFGIKPTFSGEYTKEQLVEEIFSSGMEYPSYFRGYEL